LFSWGAVPALGASLSETDDAGESTAGIPSVEAGSGGFLFGLR